MASEKARTKDDSLEGFDRPRYTIGEVVEMTGVSKARLDDYDRKGLLCPARVMKGRSQQWRLYSDADIERLGRAIVLLEYDFRIEEIRMMLDGEVDDVESIISDRIEELRRREHKLRNLLLLTKFVSHTGSDFLDGILRGPGDIDELADAVRGTRVFEESMARIAGMTEEDEAEAVESLAGIVDDFMTTDPELGFRVVERIVDRFMGWWDEWVCPLSEAGYLGFWAAFEEDSVIVEAVEELGGEPAAAFLQTSFFFLWAKRLMIECDDAIARLVDSADSDSVIAIDEARGLARLVAMRAGVAVRKASSLAANGASDADVNHTALRILDYMRNILEDEELMRYLDYDGRIAMGPSDIERAKDVVGLL